MERMENSDGVVFYKHGTDPIIAEQAEQITELHRQGNALLLEAAKDRQEIQRLKEAIVHEQHLKALARHAQVKAQIEVKLLKEELRHAYGEDKLDDFPKADEADEALDNLKQALAATPQKEESDG